MTCFHPIANHAQTARGRQAVSVATSLSTAAECAASENDDKDLVVGTGYVGLLVVIVGGCVPRDKKSDFFRSSRQSDTYVNKSYFRVYTFGNGKGIAQWKTSTSAT